MSDLWLVKIKFKQLKAFKKRNRQRINACSMASANPFLIDEKWYETFSIVIKTHENV